MDTSHALPIRVIARGIIEGSIEGASLWDTLIRDASVIDKGSSAHLPKVTMHSGSLSWGVRVKYRRYKHRPINLLAPLGNETESSRFFFFSSSPRYNDSIPPFSSLPSGKEERARVWRNDCSVNVVRQCNLEFLITISDRITNSVVEKHIFEVDRLFEWKRNERTFVLSFLWNKNVFLLIKYSDWYSIN